jgi:hypothetical protein
MFAQLMASHDGCVCVCEREREIESDREGPAWEGEAEGGKCIAECVNECVGIWVCVYVGVGK